MKFMLTFSINPVTKGRDEAIARFKKTGGQPPAGAKLLGRWTATDFSGGFVLLEGEDAKALTEFALMWSDLMELKIVPVLEDAELGPLLQRVTKPRFMRQETAQAISGTPRPRQILRARLFGISVWRGTASTAPVPGFVQSECALPSRLSTQPCFRKCCSSALRFT